MPKQTLSPLAALLFSLKKLLAQLMEKNKPSTFFKKPKQLFFHLEEFQKLLFLLQHKNVAYEAPFLEKISTTWIAIKKEAVSTRSTATPPSITEQTLHHFRELIESFPQKEELSLGYYLAKYNERNWSPFPFMQLLEQLHKESIHNTKKNTLLSWTSLLEEIQDDLKP